MAIAHLETMEGATADGIHYHLDVESDVLYLRLADRRWDETYSDEDEAGYFIVRDMESNAIIGLTILSYWKRFGGRLLSDLRFEEFQAVVAETAQMLTERMADATPVAP